MNDYYSMLKTEAETTLRPLAAEVVKLDREVRAIQSRLEDEQRAVTEASDGLAALKDTAGLRLTAGRGSYERYRTNLSKANAALETSGEIVEALGAEILPAKQAALAEARIKLAQAMLAFATAKRALCEASMTALLAVVVEEADSFTAAMERFAQDYSAPVPNVEGPRAASPRLHKQDVHRRGLLGTPSIGFSRRPPTPAATVATPVPAPADTGQAPEAAPDSSIHVDNAPASPDLDAAGVADLPAEVDALAAEQAEAFNRDSVQDAFAPTVATGGTKPF